MKKSNFMTVVIVILAVLVVLSIGLTINLYSKINNMNNGGNNVNNGGSGTIPVALQVKADDPVLGSENAPLTLVEFSDPSCPYCAAASGKNQQMVDYMQSQSPSWMPAVSGVEDNYVKTGKVRIVFKYYPGHGSGELSMKMMLCGNEQGKFWELHDLYFANQDKITDTTTLRSLASGAGVDMTKLDACLASGRPDAKIAQDMQDAQAVGVRGTPAFFLNGKEVPGGAIPYSTMKQAIDSALSG